MLTDPGTVPPLWGFYMGDSESKRRRYCLMCHVFKPERCHHCSACNRCVLNMDHHCPWVNNCVGFYNRKFFLLLLFYVILNTYIVAGSLFPEIYDLVTKLLQSKTFPLYSEGVFLGAYLLNCMISLMLSMFFRFHLRLAVYNSTTIETMDKKVVNKTSYDKGIKANWKQVFGMNPWMWLLPITGESGKPIGDGVVWNAPISVVVDDIPAEELSRKPSNILEESKKEVDEGTGRTNTAPDSVRHTLEIKKHDYLPETKFTSGRIGEKISDDVVLSPEL